MKDDRNNQSNGNEESLEQRLLRQLREYRARKAAQEKAYFEGNDHVAS